MGTRIDFVKGHGTENDFILVPDPDGGLTDALSAFAVRRLTDRYFGIGADGLIRVVPTARLPEVAHLAAEAEWFMDYRNADGSLAEMCGNGVRVMARYLLDHGLATGPTLAVATRGGVRIVYADAEGQYTVEMGPGTPMTDNSGAVTVELGERQWPAVAVSVPNPHAVAFLDDASAETSRAGPDQPIDAIPALAGLGMLTSVPTLSPEALFPDGANVEFVVSRGERHVALRVWERGVGETRSCGTGVCAAAWVAMRRDDVAEATYTVDVPGGRLLVAERSDGELLLTGPAELGVSGVVSL